MDYPSPLRRLAPLVLLLALAMPAGAQMPATDPGSAAVDGSAETAGDAPVDGVGASDLPDPPPLVPLTPDFPGFEEEPPEPDLDLPPDLRDPNRWSRICTRAGCTIAARLVSVQEARLLASLAMTHDLRAEVPVLAIFTPLGMATRPGVRLLVDDRTPIPLQVDVCLPDGCRATLEMTEETFDTILSARSLSIQYFAFGRPAPLSFPLSMDGFDEATSHVEDFRQAAAEADASAAAATSQDPVVTPTEAPAQDGAADPGDVPPPASP